MAESLLQGTNIGVQHTTGIVAAGVSSAPTPMYGDFLATHGLGLLSYAEWFQILGSIYVCFLLFKVTGILSLGKRIYDRLRGKDGRP